MNVTAGIFDGTSAAGTVAAHAREDDADAHGSGERRDGFHGYVNIREIAVDAAGSGVEFDCGPWA